MKRSALSASFRVSIFKIVGAASTTIRVISEGEILLSLAKRFFQSSNSPIISIPVNPEPQTVNVSIALRFASSRSRAALATVASI